MSKSVEWYAERYVERFGMHVLPLNKGKKTPKLNDWGNKCLSDRKLAGEYFAANPDDNIGFSLGLSGLCSIDIDCEDSFQALLAEFGLPAEDLDQYPCIKGRGRRVTFRVPDGVDLPYCKLNWPTEGDPKKKYTVVELRASCDERHRFDVLPPSIHPDTGKPYEWLVQPPKQGEWPTVPDWVLAFWLAWDKFKPQFVDACPWGPKPEPVAHKPKPLPNAASYDNQGVNVIEEFIKAHDLLSTLSNYGYTKRGNRWLSPHSSTGIAGVHIMPDGDRCYIHHASDPLCSADTNQPVNCFDLFCYYEHSGDVGKAVKAAAELLGIKSKRQAPPPPMPAQVAPASEPQEEPPAQSKASRTSSEFLCLGYNANSIYVLPRRSEQVTRLAYGSLTKSALMQIASLEWWSAHFPKKEGVDWELAMNALLRWCEAKGIYDPRNERGRGAWYDNGTPVLHLGGSLVVNGQQRRINEYESKYIYTKQATLENAFDAVPATSEQAAKLAAIFKQVNWAKPEHGMLALGWSILAPVCGAMNWRPHIWLTAQRGAGKTWFQSYIMKPVVGEETLIYCQGGTTEAGIRQALRRDARPIMFDEAEGEDASAARRMQSVLELARQSSSDTGAEIVKGTANGDGMSFNVRSMFLLGSINVGLKQAADESRFSVLSLKRPVKGKAEAERFAQFERDVLATMTPAFCASIRSRTYHGIPIIRKNAKVLAQAVAEKLGSQRMGDQVGTLLAGAFSLYDMSEYSLDHARTLIADLDFNEATEAEEVSDETNCLNVILQRQVRVDLDGMGSVTRSLGELVDVARGEGVIGSLSRGEAGDTLSRHGLQVLDGKLCVANTHAELAKTLRDSPWSTGHRRMLLRVDGAEAGPKPIRFAGSISRYVSLPI